MDAAVILEFASSEAAWKMVNIAVAMGETAFEAFVAARQEEARPVTMEDIEQLEKEYADRLTAEYIHAKHGITPADFGVTDE